ncbi:MAG: hypothetical protein MJH09_04690 [Cetobacterium sp.]|nr:hypothetical protein [Cetobacterium sp.]
MAQQVFLKKEEKAVLIFQKMQDIKNIKEFKELFKKEYPDDWTKIVARYNKHEKKDLKKKGHPMPHPEKYLENLFNVQYKKFVNKNVY